MPITKEEFFSVLETLTPEEATVIRERIAPDTKITRLKAASGVLLTDINAATARAKALVLSVQAQLDSGKDDVSLPEWKQIVEAFNGGR